MVIVPQQTVKLLVVIQSTPMLYPNVAMENPEIKFDDFHI